MGAADVVPGVSGGTVALVFGIYADLIAQVREGAHALADLVRGRFGSGIGRIRALDWWFLIPLGGGILVAVVSLASVITHFLEEEPIRTAAVFFGLVVGSLATTVHLVHRWTPPLIATAVGVAAGLFVLLGFGSGQVQEPATIFVFVGGSIAICAMILPGISGSFLLLMLGLYQYVLDAVDARDLAVIAVFGAGAVVGLALFSSALGWAFEHHEQPVLAALIGLMVGSLRVLWPWPNGTGSEESTDGAELALPAGDVVWPIALGALAAVAIVVITRVAGRRTEAVHDVAA